MLLDVLPEHAEDYELSNKDATGRRLLHHMADGPTTFKAIKALQGRRALDQTDQDGNTVLHFAVCYEENVETVKCLLDAGLAPLQENRKHLSPLDCAIGKDQFRNVVVLLEHLPRKALSRNKTLLNELKSFSNKILAELIAELARKAASSPEGKSDALVRLDRVLNDENALSVLFNASINDKAKIQLFRLKEQLQGVRPMERNESVGPKYL
jgi:ankyrin repeat protein